VSELDNIPQIKITAPKEGSVINASSVVVEFESTSDSVHAYLDNNDLGSIKTGFEINDLAEGQHKLDLEESVGVFKVRDTVTFSVNLPDSSSDGFTDQLPLSGLVPFMLISIVLLSWIYPKRDR
jgi:hypothetical protein